MMNRRKAEAALVAKYNRLGRYLCDGEVRPEGRLPAALPGITILGGSPLSAGHLAAQLEGRFFANGVGAR